MVSANKLSNIAIFLFIPFLFILTFSMSLMGGGGFTLFYIPGIILAILLGLFSLRAKSKTQKSTIKAYIALILAVLMILLMIGDYVSVKNYQEHNQQNLFDSLDRLEECICIDDFECPIGTILDLERNCNNNMYCCIKEEN